MDQKTWLWRKKSSEKITVSSDKLNLSVNKNEEETLLIDKARLEKDLELANDKLSVALSECKTKDELVKKLTNMEQEAIARWEKSKSEAADLKQELNDAVQKRLAGEERVIHLDAALKECMQQLRFVREEQEKRIHDAISKTSNEFERSQKILEDKLDDTGKRLSKLSGENTQLSKALLVKEKMIEDLNRQLGGLETDLNAIVSRLESTEKENGTLKYEVRVLEKEVEIRNEEREFNRRTADASHKQHLESVKKIAKLESECQRLRLLVRKRLPGPAALVKMKNEVEMLGRDSFEIRRRPKNPTGSLDSSLENSPETPNRRINVLTSRVSALEDENSALKEALNKMNNELQVAKIMHARTSPKPLHVESPHELSNGYKLMESGKSSLTLPELPHASMSETGSDDKVSCAESWASAVISELDHFKNGKQKGSTTCKVVGSSDLDLMDDFVEMEKLAIVSVEKSSANSQIISNEVDGKPESLETELNGYHPEPISKETVQRSNSNLDSCLTCPDWCQSILKMVFDQSSFSKRAPELILEDIRAAMKYDNPENSTDTKGRMLKPLGIDSMVKHDHQEALCGSVSRLIELVEGISVTSSDDNNSSSRTDGSFYSETPTGYTVRVFQWKTSELSTILKQFIRICYDMLNGKANIDNFLQSLNSTLDWIMNHCFSLQDVSSMRASIKKHFNCEDSRSDGDLEIGMNIHVSEVDKSCVSSEQISCLKKDTVSNDHSAPTGELQSTLSEENKEPKEELTSVESAKKGRETLPNQLQESEKNVVNLQEESRTVDQHSVNRDLDKELTAAQNELNESRRKFAALEVELDNKNNCFEELEATCLELQLQLESTRRQNPNTDLGQEEKQLRTEWEITTASEKLAECQETILNLGKQLKALATPKEAAILDKVIPTPNDETQTFSISDTPTTNPVTDKTLIPTVSDTKTTNNRFSLLDQMLAEDDAFPRDHKIPKPIEVAEPQKAILIWNGHKNGVDKDRVGNLAIVPSRKRGDVGLWRKLLWRKKKVRSQKKSLLLAA
ncbi:filament-like plant protein 7 [Cucurbita maxima]|uniref:Filament-like plant protein 7 n=1 Tax=Cucurbita maxima TaxID=3661 RepID=A0A6J1JEH7_CUCMA|nr:filament-like plant protein 7 [Cucurbita maxima]XP_022985874.1 filament-like plant protein 7 [Cucurbita maxima]